MTTALTELLNRHVESGTVPGAVGLLAPGGTDVVEIVAIGLVEVGGGPMRPDAIMRIQSMTKAITTVAALRLVETGRIGLDDSVEKWLPELADRRVLTSPGAGLDDTAPAVRPITLRHLLTNGSGYGMIFDDCPLQQAMRANGTEVGQEPMSVGSDEWIATLSEIPLAFQPGEGWRYHHSFALLGILISRLVGRPLGDHLAEDLFEPLGMVDTAFWVPTKKLDRLPAAYRYGDDGLEEVEPAGGGFYAAPPPFDVSHAELVSTAQDYYRFVSVLDTGAMVEGRPLISPEHRRLMISDQVPASAKTPESFFPGFWDSSGWGFGVAMELSGDHRGRYGWSGGQGTDFAVDPGGRVGILLSQVELGPQLWSLIGAFQQL